MKKNLFFLLIVSLFLSTGCSNSLIYGEYKTLPVSGWDKDSVAVFNVNITDTLVFCDVIANIRNNAYYPYQNIWLFVSVLSPQGTITTDTLEYYLADERGRWLGASSVGSIYSMSVLLQKKTRFKQAGVYRFTIQHGMREDVLKGIRDIGLEIQKN